MTTLGSHLAVQPGAAVSTGFDCILFTPSVHNIRLEDNTDGSYGVGTLQPVIFWSAINRL